jgi:transmembrane sensor
MNNRSEMDKPESMWLKLLEHAPDPVRLMLFGWWVRGDVSHQTAFLSACQSKDPLPEPLNALRNAVVQLSYTAVPGTNPAANPSPLPTHHRVLALGSAALSLLVIGLVLLLSFGTDGQQHYTTVIGGYYKSVLRDGSTVELNTNTELSVRMGDAQREIELLRGEASFKVAHDAKHPFSVRAGNTLVRAVGTEFTVRVRDPDHVIVLVTEGRVAISHKPLSRGMLGLVAKDTQSETLARAASAGEVATDEMGRIVVEPIEPIDMAARQSWRLGSLTLTGQTLAEAVAEFNRYNYKQIVIADPSIADVQVGGNFRPTDPQSFLEALARSMHIRAIPSSTTTTQGEVIYLYGPWGKGL